MDAECGVQPKTELRSAYKIRRVAAYCARLPVETVEWHEINAALGQVALLLETIENETPLQLSLTLLPLGSYSQVREWSTHAHAYAHAHSSNSALIYVST